MSLERLCRAVVAVSLVGCSAAPSSSSDEAASQEPAYTEDAHVRFTSASWEPSWQGTPHAGGHLHVAYAFERLPQCRNQGRAVSWVVEVNYRFDDGPITTVALSGSPGASTTLPDTGIAIPSDAHTIELWFENRAVGGYDHCNAWDSHYGQNYTHDVAP
jgi:hypothetical protein